MKAPLHRIASRLYGEPWLIRRDKYLSLCSQFKAAALGREPVRLEVPMQPAVQPQHCVEADVLDHVEISRGLAILQVHGILGKHLDSFDAMCGGFDINRLQQQAMALMARTDVETVIIHYNTPGGAAAGIADCAQILLDLAAEKRLISYVDDACSGGCWLACCAPEIYGGTSCMAGSISAVAAVEDESKLYEDLGIKVELFTDGDLKGAGWPGTSLTEAQRTDIQQRIEGLGADFKSFVKARRPKVPDAAMRGQWFYGAQALEYGLLDGHASSLEHVIAMVLN